MLDAAIYLSSTLVAVAAGLAVWTILSVVARAGYAPDVSALERERRTVLREKNSGYRAFEPLIDELVRINWQFVARERLDEIQASLDLNDDNAQIRSLEFLSWKQIEGLMVAIVIGVLLSGLASVFIAGIAAVFIAGIYPQIAVSAVTDKAVRKRSSVRMRLPFVVDLMALIMEAGGSFADGLSTAADENIDHALGQELQNVRRQVNLGRPRSEALHGFADRMGDQDVNELVFAINKGEELGTPLVEILRNQADQMRLKRSQWGEKAAAEAQVKMTFPGMVVALACMMVVMTPILMRALTAASH